MRRQMRSILAAAAVLAAVGGNGCVPAPYPTERQQAFYGGQHPVWAVAPAVNLSGQRNVDPVLQADLLFHQLQAVNNVTVIPVDRVVQVFAALRIDKVQSPEQAAVVCEQLGCDALVVPTITIYDPYDPPKLSASLAFLPRSAAGDRSPPVDARQLVRSATPDERQPLPSHPPFVQVVGMYDAVNGSVHNAVLAYAAGRADPAQPLGPGVYFADMDHYCEFVYHTLVGQLLDRVSPPPPPPPQQEARADPSDPKTSGRTGVAASAATSASTPTPVHPTPRGVRSMEDQQQQAAGGMKQLSLTKGRDHFCFRYESGQEARVLDALVDMVNRADVAFDWFDAAVLSHQLGQHLAKELKPYLPKKAA